MPIPNHPTPPPEVKWLAPNENWKEAFMACIDQTPATPEFKLLQLRHYSSGEALKTIESLGHLGLLTKLQRRDSNVSLAGNGVKLQLISRSWKPSNLFNRTIPKILRTLRTFSRRVSCRQFLVTPMSPKMAAWPLFLLVDLGTSLRDYIKRSICNPGKRGLNRNRTVVRARKIGFILVPNSTGKVKYVIIPSPLL